VREKEGGEVESGGNSCNLLYWSNPTATFLC